MKKDIEWLKKEIATEMIELEPNIKERWSDVKYQTLRSIAQKIDQLDEPEVLSEEWVDSNSVNASHDGVTEEYVHVIDLKNLIIPKQESEVTLNRAFEKVSEIYPITKEEVCRHLEKVTAYGGKVTYGEPEVLSKEWVNNNVVHVRGLGDIFEAETVENLLVPKQEELEVKIQELIEAYKQEEDAYSNPENGWISGFIEDLKNLVEKEPMYYALIKGHELTDSYDIYWNVDRSDYGVFVSRLHPLNDNFITEMSKEAWNELGINDSNADFIKVEEMK